MLGCLSAQAQTITETFGSGENEFTIEFVTIGNPGNTADTGIDRWNSPYSAGAVSYVYNLGRYEISRDQILKANAAADLGISLRDMASYGGNGENRPATGVSWNEAARFVNYLNTSQGYQAAYNFTTSGVNDNITLWTSGQAGYNASNPYRNSNAYYFLPSVDEWYKGAYYDPNKIGGAGYWKYPTGSDSEPLAVNGGTSPETAIFYPDGQFGPADITNAGGLSPYGTMAQGGNVWEWIESPLDLSDYSPTAGREWRGGYWGNTADTLAGSFRFGGSPDVESPDTPSYGFRVASVPEPSALSLLLVGGAVLMAGRRRKS